MKKNNFSIFLIPFFTCFLLNAQIKDSLFIENLNLTDYGLDYIIKYKLPYISTKYDYKLIDLNINSINQPFFNVYNKTSSLNDKYIYDENGIFTYVKSDFNSINLFRGVKIDSFNPMGLSNNNTSLVFGVFGIVLDKIQK